jgi:hypothetical protein
MLKYRFEIHGDASSSFWSVDAGDTHGLDSSRKEIETHLLENPKSKAVIKYDGNETCHFEVLYNCGYGSIKSYYVTPEKIFALTILGE